MSIDVKNLYIRSSNPGEEYIVKDASLTVPSKQITTIIGANGAGKSTLLKAIIGDIDIASGDINLNQHLINPKTNDKLRARSLAFLPQLSLLNFPYTVAEVVRLGRTPHETGDQLDAEIVNQCLSVVEMSTFAERLYPQLSGGEKQRVQIARVLAQIWRDEDTPSPRVLLLDEPNSSLDLGHQQILMQFLQEFSQQNVAILMVLHNLNTAANYSDQLIAMNHGNIVASGSPTQIMQAELIHELFGVNCKIMTNPNTGRPIVLEV